MSVVRNSHVDLLGDRELKRMLKELPGASFRKILRPAMNKASTPVLKAAKANAGAFAETKALKTALGKKTMTYPKNLVVASIIGARRGQEFIRYDRYGRKRVPSHYVHLAEAGAKPHQMKLIDSGKREAFTNIRGQHRTRKIWNREGAMHPGAKGHRFLQRAWNATRDQAIQITKAEMAAGIGPECKRLAAKGKR